MSEPNVNTPVGQGQLRTPAVRIIDELRAQLDIVAQITGRSTTEEIRVALGHWVEKIASDPAIQQKAAGPTSDQPISNNGPTASFNANVATLDANSSRRAGRTTSTGAPRNDRDLMATSSPITDRSTAGATSGATQTGTPSRSANVSTFVR
jgi:hypothetical protein